MPDMGKLDQPVIFLFSVSLGVVAIIALLSWVFAALHWTGPLGLLKGGVQ
jgi:hypothetical protein